MAIPKELRNYLDKKEQEEFAHLFSDNKDVLNILQSSGKSRPSGDFPVLQEYLKETGFHPFIKNYGEIALNHVEFIKDLKDNIQEIIFLKEIFEESTMEAQVEYIFCKIGKGYFVEINIGFHQLDGYSPELHAFLKDLSKRDNIALVSTFILYCPPEDSSLKDPEIETRLIELVKKHKLEKNTTTPSIGMICSEDGDFYIRDFYIKKDYTIKNGDLHYGAGFDDFHVKLLERFKQDSKGLILLHGLPGTGKTFYIRSLIKDLLKKDKYVIYLPPNMVDSMVDPNMMNFLATTVMEKAEEGKSCVLLLEDAEPLLVSRQTENRSGGITNLLNVTDGLLNDMLSIQVIATFNTELSNIDKALLRPERLIARKEFKKLKLEDAKILAKEIGIEKEITTDCTLAELYSQSKQNETLIHEYNNDTKPSIGFRR